MGLLSELANATGRPEWGARLARQVLAPRRLVHVCICACACLNTVTLCYTRMVALYFIQNLLNYLLWLLLILRFNVGHGDIRAVRRLPRLRMRFEERCTLPKPLSMPVLNACPDASVEHM